MSRLHGIRLPRGVWIHPLVIFLSAWTVTVALYAMHLSMVLAFSSSMVISVVAWIVIPFTLTTMIYLYFRPWAPTNLLAFRLDTEYRVMRLKRRLQIAFIIWAALTIVEIIVSGGVPLLWLIQGSSKTYFDFGIASFHGLLNSLILAIGLTGFAMYVLTRERAHLWMPGFVVTWSLIAVTRNMLIVMLLECGIVWAMARGFTWKSVTRGVVVVAALILVFGYIGDVRTGIEEFRDLAQPSANYPEWLPSGVLWVYIYVSTPINNLVNTTRSVHPMNSPVFPNATSLLIPSALREMIYSPEIVSSASTGELVEEGSWNVSTAYVGPFQDFGMFGIACLSFVMAWVSAHYWRDRSLRGSLVYAVLGQCLAMSIFYNHLFYLPVITQVVWLYVLLPKSKSKATKLPSLSPAVRVL